MVDLSKNWTSDDFNGILCREKYDNSSSTEKSRFCDMGRISKMMIESAKYIKIVECSDEDECFIGYCPGIIGPCCHGTDEIEVYRQLCEIVDEWIEILHRDNETLPSPTIGKNIEEFLNGMGNN